MKRLLTALPILAGCSSTEPVVDDGTLFLTQAVVPAAHMDALFRGTVAVDERGCYRLGLTGQATMVWPFGYRLINTIEGATVVNQDGNEVGRIGGEFVFGGGFVSTLPAGMVASETLRARAVAACPGSFWIAWPITR
ncbi:MAG: hypothetical protein ACKVZ0_22270 [Gemmatimonadales bacterium]